MERILIQAQKQKTDGILLEKPKNEEFFDADKEINVDPKTYCKLGHFHLLLEEYAKGKFPQFFNRNLDYSLQIHIFKISSYVSVPEIFQIEK